ncbi:MAG: hypothetical protein E5Y74_00105 [Mesorhizobium sp.]|nr:MAG: hypothetical protein E5Y74_00105 [Mesorhizobium sp.]
MIRDLLSTPMGIIIAILFILVAFGAVYEQLEWGDFKKEHNCVVVGKMKGSLSTGVGVSSSGSAVIVTSSESDKTGYRCDDGVTYWR